MSQERFMGMFHSFPITILSISCEFLQPLIWYIQGYMSFTRASYGMLAMGTFHDLFRVDDRNVVPEESNDFGIVLESCLGFRMLQPQRPREEGFYPLHDFYSIALRPDDS